MRKRCLYNMLVWSAVTVFMLSCKKKSDPGLAPPSKTDSGTSSAVKVFGFDGQQRYAYCPSVIVQGAERHIWFCGNDPAGVFSDHIYYVRGDVPDASRTPRIVLAPGPSGSWDDRHVCDPSVIGGAFSFSGTTYAYAMFYLGNRSDRYYNEIGVAFAQTMDVDTWIKYPNQLVTKTWTGDNDWPIGAGNAWGVGQPSAMSVDQKGKVLLTYTIGDADGTRVVAREVDLSDMAHISLGNPTPVSTAGLTNLDYSTSNIVLSDADFAYDAGRSMVYMTSHVLPTPSAYPNYIPAVVDLNKMPYADFIAGRGTWKLVQRIGPSVSGFPRNHNSAIGRDAFGVVPDLTAAEHYFTVSRADPDVSPVQPTFAEWTYQIYLSKNVDLTK